MFRSLTPRLPSGLMWWICTGSSNTRSTGEETTAFTGQLQPSDWWSTWSCSTSWTPERFPSQETNRSREYQEIEAKKEDKKNVKIRIIKSNLNFPSLLSSLIKIFLLLLFKHSLFSWSNFVLTRLVSTPPTPLNCEGFFRHLEKWWWYNISLIFYTLIIARAESR